MKRIVSILTALALIPCLGLINPAIADSEDLVQIPGALRTFGGDDGPIDIVDILGGRTFGNDLEIKDLVEILGGRIRKIKRGNKKIYITLELDNTEKHLHAFGGIGPISPPEPDGSSDILRVNGVR